MKIIKELFSSVNISRGIAIFLGCFTLLNVFGEIFMPNFSLNYTWIDFRPLPSLVKLLFLLTVSLTFLMFGFRPRQRKALHICTISFISLILIVSFINGVNFYLLLSKDVISSAFPVPFSFLITASAFIMLWVKLRKTSSESKSSNRIVIVTVILFCSFLYPLAQIFCFGKTDYRRKADAIVVFGAFVFADGRLSDALSDRVRTACKLYHDGYAQTIIFSGGPGAGKIHESEAMRNFAVELGVSESSIIVDKKGLNTKMTAENTIKIFKEHNFTKVLAVSHFYHLPRIKMTYARRGIDVYTVPAKENYNLTLMPVYIGREIVADWYYFISP